MTLGDSGIDNPSKLKNKTIGYPGIPLNIGILSSILEEQSLTIDDVELVDVGFDLVPALLSERVDAVIGAFWSHESILIEFCLLYTSPSPRDKRQSRMPSSA